MKIIQRLAYILIFIVFGVGVWTVAKTMKPLIPWLGWLSIGLGVCLIVYIGAFHLLGRYHERALSELVRAHRIVVRLSRVEGAAYYYSNELDDGRHVSTEALEYLGAGINQAVNNSFPDAMQSFYDALRAMPPDEIGDRLEWLQTTRARLKGLIERANSETSLKARG